LVQKTRSTIQEDALELIKETRGAFFNDYDLTLVKILVGHYFKAPIANQNFVPLEVWNNKAGPPLMLISFSLNRIFDLAMIHGA